MGPRPIQIVDAHDHLVQYPVDALTPAADTAPVPTSAAASSRAIGVDPSWIVLLTIASVSGLVAFTLVRSRVEASRAPSAVSATLTVDTRPAAADLFIDGERRGATPLTLSIQPGTHTLTVRNGEAERSVTFTAAEGEQLAHYLQLKTVEPIMQTARLSIATDPPGAQVSVDGRSRGVSPVIVDHLSAVEHAVTVTSKSGSAERRITLEPGATKELVFSLPRSTATLGGWVSVTSPFHVELLEQGEVVGASGTTKVMLPAGRHDLVLRNASVGYESRHSVDVVAGTVATMAVVPPKAPVSVNAVPWADIAIDGNLIGQTPIGNIMIPVGPHEITFRHPQFGERTLAIVVTVAGVTRAVVDFTR